MSAETPRKPVRRKAVWGTRALLAAALALLALLTSSCGTQVREGTASSYLIITSLTGANGADPTKFGSTVNSDVVSVVNGATTFFDDPGQASFQLALRDPGGTASPNTPSVNNAITITQYRVEYSRTDGRNTQGVDVPYAFSGAVTATVASTASVGFTLVRHDAKLEAPLLALRSNTNIPITCIATVSFYGHDQTGREVSVSGKIEITFANFGD